MATFIEIGQDPFVGAFETAISHSLSEHRGRIGEARQNQNYVRRPVRGIQIKEDTYATIHVRTALGDITPLVDAAGDSAASGQGKTDFNSNFLIQNVSESRAEKQQIVMTFGEPYIFFYGEQPRIISVTGILLNTQDFNWRSEWWENYDKHLRGTACVRQRARVYLSWDDIIVEGYIMQANAAEDAERQHIVQFQFQMFLTNYQNISNIGDPNPHYDKDNISLDISDFNKSIGAGVSTTMRVRNKAIRAAQLAEGEGKDSLLDTIRGGISFVASIDDKIVDLLEMGMRFLQGRNIRVPFGFEGSAAFDADVQLSLASIPNALEITTGEERAVQLRRRDINGKDYVIHGVLGRPVIQQTYGPLSLNVDEFIARAQGPVLGVTELMYPNIHNVFIDDQLAGLAIRKMFIEAGLNVDPDEDSWTDFLTHSLFGIASVGVGVGLASLNSSSGGSLQTSIDVTGSFL